MDGVATLAGMFEMDANTARWKIVEEIGEVADAVIGRDGTNPRKGVYKTPEDVRMELLDVALTSLVAWVKQADEDGVPSFNPVIRFHEHLHARIARHIEAVGASS